MNVNSISFGRWEPSTFEELSNKIKQSVERNHARLEDAPLYDAFTRLEEGTAGGELIIDKYRRVKDTKGEYPFFPRDSKKPNSVFHNIVAAAKYLEENNNGDNQALYGNTLDEAAD